jgi:hypothetical protein
MCKNHGECASGACQADGSCAKAASILYVDSTNAGCVTSGGGTRNAPYCQISQAVAAAIASSVPYIVVSGAPTIYGPLNFNASAAPLTIIGPGRTAAPAAQVGNSSGSNAVTIDVLGSAGLNLTFDGIWFTSSSGTTHSGVSCSQSTTGPFMLTIRNGVISNNGGWGVSSSCPVVLDADLIDSNAGGGLYIGASFGSSTVTNSIISRNTTPAVSLTSAPVNLQFDTIVDNAGPAGGASIDCTGGVVQIDNSIVVNNHTAGGTQFGSSGCNLGTVVVGSDPTTLPSNPIRMTPAFVNATNGDFHLDPTASANTACCVDKVTSTPTSPNHDHDVDLDARPIGAGWDLGADEVH